MEMVHWAWGRLLVGPERPTANRVRGGGHPRQRDRCRGVNLHWPQRNSKQTAPRVRGLTREHTPSPGCTPLRRMRDSVHPAQMWGCTSSRWVTGHTDRPRKGGGRKRRLGGGGWCPRGNGTQGEQEWEEGEDSSWGTLKVQPWPCTPFPVLSPNPGFCSVYTVSNP